MSRKELPSILAKRKKILEQQQKTKKSIDPAFVERRLKKLRGQEDDGSVHSKFDFSDTGPMESNTMQLVKILRKEQPAIEQELKERLEKTKFKKSEKEDINKLVSSIISEHARKIEEKESEDINKVLEEIKGISDIDTSELESITEAGEIEIPAEIFEPEKEKSETFEPKIVTQYERPYSDLEDKFFKEGELMDRGAYIKGEVITEQDRADAYEKALEAVPEEKQLQIRYKAELESMKKVAEDIEARHKMAPNEFPHSAKEVITSFNRIKYMEYEMNNIVSRANELLKKASERKKKKGIIGRIFSTKKGLLEPGEFDEYKLLNLELKASMKNYKKLYKEYEDIFKPLHYLAASGNGSTIAPRQLTSFNKLPKIGAIGVS